MIRDLIIEKINEDGSGEYLTDLITEYRKIGRIADDNQKIVISQSYVSSNHGEFIPISNRWVYRDLSSTNGSWDYSGNRLSSFRFHFINPGDYLEIAVTPIRFKPKVDNIPENPKEIPEELRMNSLLIVKDGEIIDEYQVQEFNKVLIVGGELENLSIGQEFIKPVLVIEDRGDDGVIVYSLMQGPEIYINNELVDSREKIKDGDVVKILNYEFYYNDYRKVEKNFYDQYKVYQAKKNVSNLTPWDVDIDNKESLKNRKERLEELERESNPLNNDRAKGQIISTSIDTTEIESLRANSGSINIEKKPNRPSKSAGSSVWFFICFILFISNILIYLLRKEIIVI